MDQALKLRVMFDMVDKITKPLKTMLAGNRELAASLKHTRRELAEMGKTQKSVASFREMRAGLESTGAQLATARARVKELAGSLRVMGPPSQRMIVDLQNTREAARALTHQHKRQTQAVHELRERLETAGISTRDLARHERDLRANVKAATAAMSEQEAKLRVLSEREKRMSVARQRMQAVQGAAANMTVSGYGARSAGTHVLNDLRATLDESRKAESEGMRIQALGLGDHATADAVKYARAMKVYGVSTTDNLTMMRDALTLFADEHHAQMVMPTLGKMKFANEALFGADDAHANEEKFMNMLKVIELRGGTKDEASFRNEAEMVQKVLTATGGRVGGDEWRNFIQTGGVAAKQLRRDAFYQQMEPLIQEMGGHAVGTGLMSAYSNVYQGKTTVKAARELVNLGLIKPEGVEYNKMGMVNHFKSGALMGGDLFQASPLEWLEKVFLPKLTARGITNPEVVKDKIATIFTNRTAANLFSTLFMQRGQIHKSARLNAGADGIDAMFAKGQQLTQGREIAALTQLRDLKLEIGEKAMPLYNVGLQATARLTARAVGFMKHHSTAAKGIITVLSALAALLVVGGTLTIALASVLGPLAILRFSMSTLGIQGGLLARALGLGAGALRLLGTAVMFAGRAMLLNPIGLAITALVAVIGAAAYAIYTHWDTIKSGATAAWDSVRTTLSTGMAWFGALPGTFATLGANLALGLINGITCKLGAVKDTIVNLASSTVGWFKDKLGIHSPSRVFAELGHYVGHGAALGIERAQGRVARAAIGLAAVAAGSFASPLVNASLPIDARSPLRGATSTQRAEVPASITINIYPQSGVDAQAIAREAGRVVAIELDRRERAKRSRAGSSLSDRG